MSLPYLGIFALVDYKKERGLIGKFKSVSGRYVPSFGEVSARRVLKFYANVGWRRYFAALRNKT